MLRLILFLDILLLCISYRIPSSYKSWKFHSNPIILHAHIDMNWDPKAAPKLDFNEDYYSVLEATPDIEPIGLKKKYYKLITKYHPDNKRTEQEKELCNKQMMVINNAYKILKEAESRQKYDMQRRIGNYGSNSKVKQSSSNTNSATSASSSTQSTAYANKQQNYNTNNTYNKQYQQQTASSSYNNAYNNNPYSKQEAEEPLESMGDILSELWAEISRDGGKNLFEDLLEFLEEQVGYGCMSSMLTFLIFMRICLSYAMLCIHVYLCTCIHILLYHTIIQHISYSLHIHTYTYTDTG